MTFNDTTTKNGAIQECETWLFGSNYGAISDNPNLLYTFTRLLNNGVDQTFDAIWKADGSWRHTDPNDTTISEDTTDLSLSTQTYTLALDHVKITGFQILRTNGLYENMTDITYQDQQYTQSSDPTYFVPTQTTYNYKLKGDSITIYPALTTSAVTLTNGLKVIYQSEATYFVSTDTDVEMPIPRTFQDIPVLFACSKYAKSNSMTDKSRDVDSELGRRLADITNFFNTRKVASVKRMNANQENNK